MSKSELFEDLDPKIAGPLQRITEALKAEIGSQIDGVRRDVQSLLGAETAAPAPAPESAADELDPLEELKHAAAEIDRATKQAAILAALLEGAGRFSSRAAFILIRDDGQRCWGSLGFEDAGRDMTGASIEVNGASPWARMQDGAGTRGLSAEDCAAFCDQFEAASPAVGALLPLSLGDNVAGYLYADRIGDGPLNITALQLLTFVAGQSLETLPVRKRASTPALVVAGAAAEPMPALEPEPVAAEPEPAAVEPEPLEAEPEVAATEPEPMEEPEPVEAEPEAAAPEPEPEEFPLEAAVTEPDLGVEPAPAPVDEAGEVQDEGVPEGLLETIPVEVVPEEAEDVDTDTLPPAAEPETEVPPTVEASGAVSDFYEVEAEPSAPSEPPPAEPSDTAPPFDAEATAEFPVAATEATEEVTDVAVEEAPPVEPEATPAPESQAPPTAPPTEGSSTQVVPPDDVLGPGWAFTAKEATDDSGNEALHEEARRLARLLVTEIKLYNEEQVDQGRRGGDIYRRLQEDIDRSRQIFEDRIDQEIRRDSDYFQDALVRILAGGDESLLGM